MRATIRERGTARMVLLPLVFIGWAGTAIATAAVITVALSTLVPLMVLVAGFEAIFALHINVERLGRYLQVFHEADGGWEPFAMRFGQRFPGAGPDALFSRKPPLLTIKVPPLSCASMVVSAAGREPVGRACAVLVPRVRFLVRKP